MNLIFTRLPRNREFFECVVVLCEGTPFVFTVKYSLMNFNELVAFYKKKVYKFSISYWTVLNLGLDVVKFPPIFSFLNLLEKSVGT